jgi:hypothetical protein
MGSAAGTLSNERLRDGHALAGLAWCSGWSGWYGFGVLRDEAQGGGWMGVVWACWSRTGLANEGEDGV